MVTTVVSRGETITDGDDCRVAWRDSHMVSARPLERHTHSRTTTRGNQRETLYLIIV